MRTSLCRQEAGVEAKASQNAMVCCHQKCFKQDLIASDIGLRSLNKLKSAHGGLYMGVHFAQSTFYLVLGTTTKPVTTPKGVVVNDDPKGAWASLSISCDNSILPAIQ